MNEDKELLTLAAKAAGIYDECEWFECKEEDGSLVWCLVQGSREWNPLTDDGDALRLAVRLGITVVPDPYKERRYVACRDFTIHKGYLIEACENGDDPYAATRRAIVRAASEIGRGVE